MASSSSSNVYQFKITLEGTNPKIWRRIQVPADYRFWDLHVAIADAMDWEDYHLHQFSITNPATGVVDEIGLPDPDGACEFEHVLSGIRVKIAEYFTSSNKSAKYLYDFGDNWWHEILLEEIIPAMPGVKYPRCVAGERSGPPEDCGGVCGYRNLLRVIANPQHKEHNEMVEWLKQMKGDNFDPAHFDPKSVKFADPNARWRKATSHY